MNYRTLLPSLQYRGLVKAIKRNYHVLEASQYYVVFSPKDDESGNYTIVPKRAAKFIVKKLGGKKGITTAEVFDACKGSMFFPDRLSVLSAIYALIGAKRGRFSKVADRKLFFNIWKESN
jgi:hypothetical protein